MLPPLTTYRRMDMSWPIADNPVVYTRCADSSAYGFSTSGYDRSDGRAAQRRLSYRRVPPVRLPGNRLRANRGCRGESQNAHLAYRYPCRTRWLPQSPGYVQDRKSVVWGKSVSVRLDLGGR